MSFSMLSPHPLPLSLYLSLSLSLFLILSAWFDHNYVTPGLPADVIHASQFPVLSAQENDGQHGQIYIGEKANPNPGRKVSVGIRIHTHTLAIKVRSKTLSRHVLRFIFCFVFGKATRFHFIKTVNRVRCVMRINRVGGGE